MTESRLEVGRREPAASPYEHSLIGEYSRMLMLLVAVPLLLWFIQPTSRQQLSSVSVVSVLVLLLTLLTGKGVAWLRSLLVVAMTLNVLAAVINPEDLLTGRNTSPFKFSSVILLVCLFMASVFELGALARESSNRTRWKALGWSLLAAPALVYAVGIPLATSLWESLFAEQAQLVGRNPNWTMPREISFRFAKLVVFAAFTYLGACFGSFLNVVAWCVPRGKSFTTRDSCCPKCNKKIRRIDNLPIFSYINLAAKCRNCKASIPAKYLVVELVVAGIFGSLFLYELVTGAANVPGARGLSHTGILWIILYPKWNVIAVYFFHAAFMSMLLVLSLIERDNQKLKWHQIIGLVIAFVLPATIFSPLQPVPCPGIAATLGIKIPLLSQILKILVGGLAGGLIGACGVFSFSRTAAITFVPAMIVTGAVLGWQSVVHVSVLLLLILLASRCVPRVREFFTGQHTMLIFIAVMLHHPLWKFVFENLTI